MGYRCPAGINAGEFTIDLISKSLASPEVAAESDARIQRFEEAASKLPASRRARSMAQGGSAEGSAGSAEGHAKSAPPAARRARRVAAGAITQFRMLFRRAWREVARSKAALSIKVVQQVMIALIYGGIYQLGLSQVCRDRGLLMISARFTYDGGHFSAWQSSIQDRFGLISLISIGAGNLAIAGTIRTFPKEKVRHRRGHFR